MTTRGHRSDPGDERHALVSLERPARPEQSEDGMADVPASVPDGPRAAERPTLTLGEAAQLLGVSPWLVQQQVAQGVLPCVRLGRRILISRSRLLTWLDTGY